MSQFLPLRANVEWLKKTAKQHLDSLRASNPEAQLSDAQLAVARDFGFSSWRAMIAHVEEVREKLRQLVPADTDQPADTTPIPPDDPQLAQLLAAIEAGNTQSVVQLLRSRPAIAKAHGPEGQTPLHAAAQFNDPNLGVVLLAFGADPYAKFGESAHTALSWAVVCNSIEFAKSLVRLGAKPDFYCAAGIGSVDDVRSYFDDAGELLPDASKSGSSRFAADGSRLPCPPPTSVEQISDALYMACRNGQAEVVRFLLTKRPDLTFQGFMGGTPLHWAYFGGSKAVVDLLLAAGADATARNNDLGCTPRAFGICTPANWGFLFLVQRQLQADDSLLNYMDGKTSALHEAAQNGHLEVVRFLLNRGADRLIVNGDGKQPRDLALERGHLATAELLK